MVFLSFRKSQIEMILEKTYVFIQSGTVNCGLMVIIIEVKWINFKQATGL